MIDLKTLSSAVNQIAAEKGIAAEKIMEALEAALAAAYKREYRERGEAVKAKFDLKSGKLDFWQIKTVVDESTVRMSEEEEPAEGAAKEPEGGRRSGKKTGFQSSPSSFLEEAKKIKKTFSSAMSWNFRWNPTTTSAVSPRRRPSRLFCKSSARPSGNR